MLLCSLGAAVVSLKQKFLHQMLWTTSKPLFFSSYERLHLAKEELPLDPSEVGHNAYFMITGSLHWLAVCNEFGIGEACLRMKWKCNNFSSFFGVGAGHNVLGC